MTRLSWSPVVVRSMLQLSNGNTCHSISHAEPVGDVAPRGFRWPDYLHHLSSLHPKVPRCGIVELNPRQLGLFELVAVQQSILLVIRHRLMLRHELVMSDIDN